MNNETDAIEKLHAQRVARLLLSLPPPKMIPKIWFQQQLALSRAARDRALDLVLEQNPYDYLQEKIY